MGSPDLMLRRRVAPSRSMEAGATSLAAVLRDACNAVKPPQTAKLPALHAPQDQDLAVVRSKETLV
jgi:hypothetical protein